MVLRNNSSCCSSCSHHEQTDSWWRLKKRGEWGKIFHQFYIQRQEKRKVLGKQVRSFLKLSCNSLHSRLKQRRESCILVYDVFLVSSSPSLLQTPNIHSTYRHSTNFSLFSLSFLFTAWLILCLSSCSKTCVWMNESHCHPLLPLPSPSSCFPSSSLLFSYIAFCSFSRNCFSTAGVWRTAVSVGLEGIFLLLFSLFFQRRSRVKRKEKKRKEK